MEQRSHRSIMEDREKISTEQEWEMERLRKKFGVTNEEIKAAVKAVGHSRQKVEAFLKDNRSEDTIGNP